MKGDKCGAQGVLYEYPAWTFGTKRVVNDDTAGPGSGAYRPHPLNNTSGPKFGAPRLSRTADPRGQAYIPDGRYLKPGYLSQEPRQPAYSFGTRNLDAPNGNPGPNSYDTRDARNVPTSSWGPAPRQYRPATAPSLRRPEEVTRKAKGPSFGLPYKSRQEITPGPLDYQCGCGGSCCRYCDSYAGVTINGRLPTMYGVNTTHSPGPQAYHTDCSTIGVAGKTQRCESARPIGGTGFSASMGWTAPASSQQPQQRRR